MTIKVDTFLLKQQRDTLHAVIGRYIEEGGAETAEHLTGLENLLDNIYDQIVPVTEDDE